jgi:type II secretory pathway pseudopilin PulG
MRSQEGFTLTEVVMAMTVGFVILSATLGLLESSTKLNLGVMAKTDAMQRGRLVMDQVTQRLRSQVCLDFQNPAVLANSNAQQVTFYSDFSSGDGSVAPLKTQLLFVPSAGDPTVGAIWEYRFRTTSTVKPPPVSSFPSTPTTRRLLSGNVALQRNSAGATVPFLRYYAFRLVSGRPQASNPLAVPLDTARAETVARIDVAFRARPSRARNDKESIDLTDQVIARHADPNETPPTNVPSDWAPNPDCL